ncbi:LONG AFTER FAR-RED 3-like protein [Drosera capensis]
MNPAVVISAAAVLLTSIFLLPFLNPNNTKDSLNSGDSVGGVVADLLVTNGVIYTVDPEMPFADSMAIRNGRVLRIGNYSSLKELEGNANERLDLEGKLVLPGFIDSHLHLIYGGLQMAQVELRDVSTKEEFISKVKLAAEGWEQGSWILGGGWNNDLWGGDLPLASWIDDITPNNPLWLSRMDGHMGLANSLALKVAGITRDTEDPAGGIIVKDDDGDPTGLLIDSARKLLLSMIPEASVNERREALVRASNYALSKGVTMVVDLGRYFPGASSQLSWDDLTELMYCEMGFFSISADVYLWEHASRNMNIRSCLFFPMETWSRLAELIQTKGRMLSEWIYLGGVKAFIDGSLGSNSALFYQSYTDDAENYGLQVTDLDSVFNMTSMSDKSELQVAIHAIGDKANDLILDLYKSVAASNGARDRRFRIEHAQHLAPGSPALFGEQGIIASVQPEHLLYDADSAIKKLGEERAQKGSYLFHSLLANNAELAFGSDWPVADIDPLWSIRTAVKRIPLSWQFPWIPSEQITVEDAIAAHTISAARSCFLDHELGSLSPGKLADFVVLSTDSWEDFLKEVSATIDATYVGGRQAYPPLTTAA